MKVPPTDFDIATATPNELLQKQTWYLQEIHHELMRRKHFEDRVRFAKWAWIILKYAFIIGAILYFAHTVQSAILSVQNAVPKMPDISLPSFK